jgi:hypothetical protein
LEDAIRANKEKITCGYIYLPDNPLVIPSRLQLADKSELDSFALAVARAGWSDFGSVKDLGSKVLYANFISEDKLRKSKVLLSASAVVPRKGQEEKEKKEKEKKLRAAIGERSIAVIVGGGWSRDAAGRGGRVDVHETPVGPIVGAMLHANFVEAILDARFFRVTSERALHAWEIVFSLIAAIALASIPSALGKLARLLPLCLILLFIQWAALHGLGVFFDAYVPLVGVALHSISERLIGSHNARWFGGRSTGPRARKKDFAQARETLPLSGRTTGGMKP